MFHDHRPRYPSLGVTDLPPPHHDTIVLSQPRIEGEKAPLKHSRPFRPQRLANQTLMPRCQVETKARAGTAQKEDGTPCTTPCVPIPSFWSSCVCCGFDDGTGLTNESDGKEWMKLTDHGARSR